MIWIAALFTPIVLGAAAFALYERGYRHGYEFARGLTREPLPAYADLHRELP